MTTEVFSTIPRVYTALAQWLACLLLILTYRRQWRLRGRRMVFASALALAALAAELGLTGDLPVAFWIPSMMGSVALMYAYLSTCLDVSPVSAGYYCVRAFLLSELAASLEWQLYYYGVTYLGVPAVPWVEWTTLAVIYGAVFWLAVLLERRCSDDGRSYPVTARELLSCAAIGIAAFAISNLSFVSSNTPFSGRVAQEVYNIRTLVDIGGVAILYAYHIQRRELRLRYERDAIQNVLQTQYAQYRQSRDSIDLINWKYHDLKHQIAALRAEGDPARRAAWLDEMESDIAVYEAQNKTGNGVLDTVLTSKILYCQKHHVTLTCVADGSLLDFMDVMDICTIFGNALDNAIESVLQIADKDKRLIHLSVSAQRGFLLIQVENYFEGHLEFQEGLPVSTKGDDRFHGYGLKSIRYSAERYGGTLSVSAEKQWFNLNILIPLERAA